MPNVTVEPRLSLDWAILADLTPLYCTGSDLARLQAASHRHPNEGPIMNEPVNRSVILLVGRKAPSR